MYVPNVFETKFHTTIARHARTNEGARKPSNRVRSVHRHDDTIATPAVKPKLTRDDTMLGCDDVDITPPTASPQSSIERESSSRDRPNLGYSSIRGGQSVRSARSRNKPNYRVRDVI